MHVTSRVAVAVCVSLAISRAAADAPEALYIFPAGGQRGTTVEVRIGGMHLFDECPLHFDATDVIAPSSIRRTKTVWFEGPVIPQPDSQRAENYPSDYAARLSIAPDARLGTRWWRVSTSQGVTPSLRFVVGELPEIIEEEIDGEPIPVAVTLPVTINGRVFPREDIDEWSFQAKKGQTIRCEVEADRLGSPLDSQLEIVDAAGRRLAVNSDHYGTDSLIVFTAPADGEYRARIFDAAYSGLQTHVYRLTISDRPHVTSVYPLGGRRGEKTAFELAGIGLSAKPQALAIPKDAPDDYAARFANGGTATNEVLLETSDVAELREDNDMTLTLPCVANGRIEQPGDADSWTFDAVKGQEIEFDLRAASLGSPLDAVLTIVTADGKEPVTSDDRTATDPDPRLRYVVPTDGRYTIRTTERSPNRGGADFAYRLHVGAGSPAFTASMPTDAVTVDRGTTQGKFRISATRPPGYDGELKVVVDGLPDGVTVGNDKIARGRNETSLSFKAEADVPVGLHECRVRVVTLPSADAGKGKKKDDKAPEVVFEEMSATAAVAVSRGEPPMDVLHLSVAMPTPFEVVAEFELPYAPRGTSYVRHYRLDRKGYEGPLEIRMAEKQMRHLQGVQGTTMTIPAGVDEFDYPVYLPTFLELARTSRTVITAFGEVEADGERHKVCFTSIKPSEQISLIIGPGPLTVAAEPPTAVVAIEKPVEVAVRIDRDAATKGPVRVELLTPPHVRGVSADSVVAPPGEERVTLRVRFAADAGPFNMPLTVRATHGEGLKRVVAESPLEIISP